MPSAPRNLSHALCFHPPQGPSRHRCIAPHRTRSAAAPPRAHSLRLPVIKASCCPAYSHAPPTRAPSICAPLPAPRPHHHAPTLAAGPASQPANQPATRPLCSPYSAWLRRRPSSSWPSRPRPFSQDRLSAHRPSPPAPLLHTRSPRNYCLGLHAGPTYLRRSSPVRLPTTLRPSSSWSSYPTLVKRNARSVRPSVRTPPLEICFAPAQFRPPSSPA